MPLSRSPRMDRRRRTIRENLSVRTDDSDEGRVSPSRTGRAADLPELTKKERGVAYSHSVRRACQHRLVQFIPVRKLSLTGAVAASVVVPIMLMMLHYLVFVSGTLDWAGHPMSALLNANSPRSLAAWLSSHLWLMCLAATVLTFRLRKHKLDDYEGEYRLWFWLVFTCVIGSIDSTTRLTELFGAALDRWSTVNVGWSGVAIVQATLATLIGLLGLRMCTELKAVPTSLVLWLSGLLCWAGSAALSQSLLHLDMAQTTRSWLRASLWMSGLTCIWLCGLFYLRAIFMEAQKRFLSRSLATSQSMPWSQRLRQALPTLPSLPRFGRRAPEAGDEEEVAPTARRKKSRMVSTEDDQRDDRETNVSERPQQRSDARDPRDAQRAAVGNPSTSAPRSGESVPEAPTKKRWGFGLGRLALRAPTVGNQASRHSQDNIQEADQPRSQAAHNAEVDREYGKKSGWFGRRQAKSEETETQPTGSDQSSRTRRNATRNDGDSDQPTTSTTKRTLRDRLTWKRQPKDADGQDSTAPAKSKSKPVRESDESGEAPEGKKRSWLRIPKPSLPKMSLPKVRLPKLKLPSFRLPPPAQPGAPDGADDQATAPRVANASSSSRPLPTTSDQESDNSRNLSKAERKRLKRMQRDDDGERRAA